MKDIKLNKTEIMLVARNNYGDYTTPEELADRIRQAARDTLESWLIYNMANISRMAEKELN